MVKQANLCDTIKKRLAWRKDRPGALPPPLSGKIYV
jgi:hypothetical protein